MKNYFKNITSVILSLLLLSGGNFAFALTHGDCIIVSNEHSTCEMECCLEIPCGDEENNGEVQIKDVSYLCCNVHIEQNMQQDYYTMPLISKTTYPAKIILFSTINSQNFNSLNVPILIIQNFKTTNIFLVVSNLRI